MMRSLVDMKFLLYLFIMMIDTLSHSYTQQGTSNNYDYFATTECLKEPLPAQYGGGIVSVMKLVNGSKFSQSVRLKSGLHYVLSAWIQVSEGSENVITSAFRYPSGVIVEAGSVIAKHGCWAMLKGGIVANVTTPADIIFQAKNGTAEIWVENVSLQPFTKEQWRYHQEDSISKLRKKKISLKVIDAANTNKTLGGAKVIINQGKSNFPFGCAMTNKIIDNPSYQNWFASRFKVTALRNEMKWYANEPVQGQENYADSDNMVDFALKHGIAVRAHNIFWNFPQFEPRWVNGLDPSQLQAAMDKRINSVMSRYAGKVISWDVVNENLHFRFFEDKLGNNFSNIEYAKAHELDRATLFMNEFNTVEYGGDPLSLPQNYINRLRDIQTSVGGAHIGIGLQGHFNNYEPNIAYMRSALDILDATGMPVWLTEVDVKPTPNQPQYLEQILREGYAHPAVQGIVMWSGPALDQFEFMTLADYNFKNTPVGDVVDRLLKEWRSEDQEHITDDDGSLEVSLFHGEYDVTVVHPLTDSSATLRVNTNDPSHADKSFHIHIHV